MLLLSILSTGWVTIFIAIVFTTIVVMNFRTVSKLRKTEKDLQETEEQRLKLAQGVISTDSVAKEEIAKRDAWIKKVEDLNRRQALQIEEMSKTRANPQTDTNLETENEALKAALDKSRANETKLANQVSNLIKKQKEAEHDVAPAPLEEVADAYIYEDQLYYKASGSSRKWKAAQENGKKIKLLTIKS